MAVTVAVLLFTAQILGAGATIEGLASVSFATERIFAEVEQLSRHVFSASQEAQAALRANVGQESRRLAEQAVATNYCEWSGSAGGNCSQNNAWSTAKLSNVSNPMIKSMATRAMKCATFLTQTACQDGSCKWDGGACDITMTAGEEQAMMGLFVPSKGCGWIGAMMQASAKCSTPGVCKASDKCKSSTEKKPSDDGKSCKSASTCAPTDAASQEAMCPGINVGTMQKECQAKATAVFLASTDEHGADNAIAANLACIMKNCSAMGAMMGATATCKALTWNDAGLEKTPAKCSSNSQCTWDINSTPKSGHGGTSGTCVVNMATLIPAGCPLKGMMDLQTKCPKSASKANCVKERACSWNKKPQCSIQQGATLLTSTEGCTPTPTAMTSAMATSTDNKDVKMFAGVAQQQSQCLALRTQEACTGADNPFTRTNVPVASTVAAAMRTNVIVIASLLTLASF